MPENLPVGIFFETRARILLKILFPQTLDSDVFSLYNDLVADVAH